MDAYLSFKFKGRLHLGVCGSIAAYKAPDLVRQWQDAGLNVSVTLTPAAQKFILPITFKALGAEPVYTSMFDDLEAPSPFAHLEPGQVSQAMVIAPASASTIARLAQGQADDLLACQALARRSPLVVAPAMNPAMWSNPATQANIACLKQRDIYIVPPGIGRTACGEEGQGRLADLQEVYLAGLKALSPQDLAGQKIMLTIGPTRESFDGLRFWSNPSSGTQGAALAVAAWLRGAEVWAITGPGVPWLPAEIKRHKVQSALEMYQTAADIWPHMNVGIFTAAVADFKPDPVMPDPLNPSAKPQKFKKSSAPHGFDLHFSPNPDILLSLSQTKGDKKIIGFAAESKDLETAVRGKLGSKNADLIVGNLIDDAFAKPATSVFVADKHGTSQQWSNLPKTQVAWKVLSWLTTL